MMERCAEKISTLYREIGIRRVREKRCFFVKMNPKYGVGGATQREHRGELKRFFLPLFEHKRECSLFGVEPNSIAEPSPELDIIPASDHWTIKATSRFKGHFRYWTGDVSTPAKHEVVCRLTLVISVDLQADEAELTELLRRAWDPVVFSNPQSMVTPAVLNSARTNSRGSRTIELAYRINPIEMRIGLIGAADTLASVYEKALDVAQASQYFGHEFYNEERGVSRGARAKGNKVI